MDTKRRSIWRAGAAVLCLAVLAGCGRERAGEEALERAQDNLPAAYNPAFAAKALNLAGVSGIDSMYDIYAVVPNQGPLAGGNPARLDGVFPDPTSLAELAAARDAYTVYFGNNIAPYNTAFFPFISGERIYVTVPTGDAPGLVDVIFRDITTLRDAAALYDGYEYLATSFSIYDVVPNRGWIFGDEAANIEGMFPVTNAFSQSLLGNIAGASQYYRVYFDFLDNGGRLAAFDATVMDPVISAMDMYVRSPFGDDVELVDVTIISHDNGDFSNSQIAQLNGAYKYYAMYLTRVIPNQGPVAGLNSARLEGFLPGLAQIRNIYSAYAAYAVYFGGNRANFVDPAPTPVFQPSQIISMAARIYTTGFMYVEVPPGAGPGFVDVRIEDLEPFAAFRDETTICPDCYEYIDNDGIGQWTNAEIFPSPVGKLPAGDLLVRITVTGELRGDDTVFIVPHGGNPNNAAHRIDLEEISSGPAGGNWVWEGTNTDEIPRVLEGGALLVDGHAAVYVVDTERGELVGDDPGDLTDGSIIEGLALEGRHFIIDTIPPRLRLVPLLGRLRGDDFVSGDIPGDWGVTAAMDFGAPQPTPQHPFDMTDLIGYPEVPFAGNWMERPRRANSNAQVFFRVSSLTNFFTDSLYSGDEPTAGLRFVLRVAFEDVDIYTMMNRVPGALDVNLFSGTTDRIVAGFPESPVQLPVGPREEVLTANPVNQDVLIAWDFQPTPTQLPNIRDITATYRSDFPRSLGGNPGLSSNLDPAFTVLIGEYIIGDPGDPTSGVQVMDTGPRTLMPVVFRAVDRAGDYFPLGDPAEGRQKLFTENDTSGTDAYDVNQQPEVGPLNLWWLRSTATRVRGFNLGSSGDAPAPEFTWANTGEPPTDTVFDPIDGLGVQRLYSFAVYSTDGQGTREEQRDGLYTLLVPWSAWGPQNSLSQAAVTSFTDGLEGRWFLLVVMSCDEAGNVEVWPEDQLRNPSGTGPQTIESVNENSGAEERNWERWYVPFLGQQVDTRVEPYFWHESGTFDGTPDPATETQFGDAEVIPYPSIRAFNPQAFPPLQIVAGQFRMTLSSEAGLLGVEWELVGNGVSFGVVNIPPDDITGNTVLLSLPFDAIGVVGDYLGAGNRSEAYYTLRAQAYVDANDNGQYDGPTSEDTIDTSPASVQFVVVDNVAEFIQRRKSEDTQPIQEMDRPQ